MVGIASRYGLDGPGIESPWGARFSAPVQTGPGAHPASCTMGTGSFPGVKRPGPGTDHTTHLAPRLKEEYSYTSTPPLGLCGLFWVNFTFTFTSYLTDTPVCSYYKDQSIKGGEIMFIYLLIISNTQIPKFSLVVQIVTTKLKGVKKCVDMRYCNKK
jgi:hypothetical protein